MEGATTHTVLGGCFTGRRCGHTQIRTSWQVTAF